MTLKPSLHEGLGLIWNWNRTILVVKNLKLGLLVLRGQLGPKSMKWHVYLHGTTYGIKKLGPREKKTTYGMDNQFSPLGPRSVLMVLFFKNNHNCRIKNVTLGDGVKWGAIKLCFSFPCCSSIVGCC